MLPTLPCRQRCDHHTQKSATPMGNEDLIDARSSRTTHRTGKFSDFRSQKVGSKAPECFSTFLRLLSGWLFWPVCKNQSLGIMSERQMNVMCTKRRMHAMQGWTTRQGGCNGLAEQLVSTVGNVNIEVWCDAGGDLCNAVYTTCRLGI